MRQRCNFHQTGNFCADDACVRCAAEISRRQARNVARDAVQLRRDVVSVHAQAPRGRGR